MGVRIICQSAELALECLKAAQLVGLSVEPEVTASWQTEASSAVAQGTLALALEQLPTLDQLVELSQLARNLPAAPLLAMLGEGAEAERLRHVARDLGLTALGEVAPLISALCLRDAGIDQPWLVSARALSRVDRLRLSSVLLQSTQRGALFVRREAPLLAIAGDAQEPGRLVGQGRDVALAITALRDTDRETPQIESSVDDVDPRSVLDVLFGPSRALSDPASKAALMPYGIPVPIEELCASPSRASAEASRIGYPVRISLASPDLRLWDHADLAIDMVDNAAHVRDTFRQLMALGKQRLDELGVASAQDRLLGVTVTATSQAAALLGVRAWPLSGKHVAMEIAFADAHGVASNDCTLAVLPAPHSAIERVLRRLAGQSLIFKGSAAQRKAHLEAIADVLLRLSAFVNDRRAEIVSVELRPLALLLDGSAEAREACVHVSDAFERSLSMPARAAH